MRGDTDSLITSKALSLWLHSFKGQSHAQLSAQGRELAEPWVGGVEEGKQWEETGEEGGIQTHNPACALDVKSRRVSYMQTCTKCFVPLKSFII